MTAMPRSRRLATPVLIAGALALALVGSGPGKAPSAGPLRAHAPATIVAVDSLRAPASSVASRVLVASEPTGYTFLSSSIVGQTPGGFSVWVDPRAPHHWLMAKNSAATVTALRSLGTRVTYRGYGTPATREGIVRVREGLKGCGSGGGTVGVTWTYWRALSSGKNYVTRADVYLCPRLFRLGTWATQATVGHELGHAMGLGHVSYRYFGSYQLMNPVVRSSVLTYRSGDRRGLARLARQTAAIKPAIPPVGSLDKSQFQSDGTLAFTGWALLQYYKANPVTIVLTDNGKVVRTSGTPILRADVNRTQDPGTRTHGYRITVPWNGGSHDFCVTARSTLHPAAAARLGCITWHD